jgi:4-hydroxybenzoate polyprenyltransferase
MSGSADQSHPGVGATIRTWSEMVKFSHSVFALPFAMMATFLAGREIDGVGHPHRGQLFLIILCMVAARSVAMTFNRIVDAKIDARNPRTAGRPIPAGLLTMRAAVIFLIVATVVFGLGCLGFSLGYENDWPILLAGPTLLYLCGYSLTKRFTRWSHFYLGSAIAFSPVAAWIAIDPGSLGLSAVALMGAVTFWIAGFDMIYACQDIDVDRAEGLHSLPSRLGVGRALCLARMSHALAVVLLTAVGWLSGLGWIYYVGVLVVACLLVYENSLVRADDLSRVNLAFFTVNGIVSVVLGFLAIVDIMLAMPAVLPDW